MSDKVRTIALLVDDQGDLYKFQDITGPVQQDLPSTDQASEEVKQAATLKEGDNKPAQNGQLTEDQRWARDRTGWAPQFVQPDEKREEVETLLDHRTFLEEKLGDKFFGGELLCCLFPRTHLKNHGETALTFRSNCI